MFLLISSRSYRCPKAFTCDARWRPQRRHPWKALVDPKNRQVAERQVPAANDPHDKNLLAEFHRIYVSIRKQPHGNTGNSKEDAEWNMHVGLYYTYSMVHASVFDFEGMHFSLSLFLPRSCSNACRAHVDSYWPFWLFVFNRLFFNVISWFVLICYVHNSWIS